MVRVAASVGRWREVLASLLASLATPISAETRKPAVIPPLVFIGQDLGAIRSYSGSRCCAATDGTTAYINLYALLSEKRNFGGLGVDLAMRPVDSERGWGAGPVSAWKSAFEFDAPRLAIGVSITESDEPDGLRRILAGEFDAQIRHLANFVTAMKRPVFLRIGYEFDGAWNKGYERQARYVAVWRHIVELIRSEGAHNAVFVWQSATSPIDDLLEGRHEDISGWYPGDDYVDWMALSWFLRPDEGPAIPSAYRPPTARALADELVSFARARRKPVMVAELSPQGYDLLRHTNCNISPVWDGSPGQGCRRLSAAQIWSEWFAPFFAYAQTNADAIRAIAYINVDWDAQPMWGPPYAQGYWGDTRLDADPVIARRWNAAVARWRAVAADKRRN